MTSMGRPSFPRRWKQPSCKSPKAKRLLGSRCISCCNKRHNLSSDRSNLGFLNASIFWGDKIRPHVVLRDIYEYSHYIYIYKDPYESPFVNKGQPSNKCKRMNHSEDPSTGVHWVYSCCAPLFVDILNDIPSIKPPDFCWTSLCKCSVLMLNLRNCNCWAFDVVTQRRFSGSSQVRMSPLKKKTIPLKRQKHSRQHNISQRSRVCPLLYKPNKKLSKTAIYA